MGGSRPAEGNRIESMQVTAGLVPAEGNRVECMQVTAGLVRPLQLFETLPSSMVLFSETDKILDLNLLTVIS